MKLYILLALLLLPVASALLVSPAEHNAEYRENSKETFTIRVTNDEASSVNIKLSATGPLSELLDFEESFFLAPKASREVTISLLMPSTTQPGILESGVLIESSPSGSGISAASAVLHRIRITTPQQGAYLAGRVLASAGVVGKPVLITVSVTNTGTDHLDSVEGSLAISQESFPLSMISLAPGETKDYTLSWTPIAVGTYTARAELTYADKQASISSSIPVGNLSVRLLGVDAGEFRLGDPFRLSIISLNEWGQPLPVAMRVEVMQNNESVSSGTTAANVQLPLSQARSTVFLESNQMQVGPATIHVEATYGDRSTSEDYGVLVAIDELIFDSQKKQNTTLIIIVIAIVLAALVVIFIYGRKVKRTRGGNE